MNHIDGFQVYGSKQLREHEEEQVNKPSQALWLTRGKTSSTYLGWTERYPTSSFAKVLSAVETCNPESLDENEWLLVKDSDHSKRTKGRQGVKCLVLCFTFHQLRQRYRIIGPWAGESRERSADVSDGLGWWRLWLRGASRNRVGWSNHLIEFLVLY